MTLPTGSHYLKSVEIATKNWVTSNEERQMTRTLLNEKLEDIRPMAQVVAVGQEDKNGTKEAQFLNV